MHPPFLLVLVNLVNGNDVVPGGIFFSPRYRKTVFSKSDSPTLVDACFVLAKSSPSCRGVHLRRQSACKVSSPVVRGFPLCVFPFVPQFFFFLGSFFFPFFCFLFIFRFPSAPLFLFSFFPFFSFFFFSSSSFCLRFCSLAFYSFCVVVAAVFCFFHVFAFLFSARLYLAC